MGVANYFLDIGVRDPKTPGEFIAGVECDGAAYHSEASARDRDRLRQEILENLGWNILRVWSTDWFRDPNGELERIRGSLDRLITAREEQRGKATATAPLADVPDGGLKPDGIRLRSADLASVEQPNSSSQHLRCAGARRTDRVAGNQDKAKVP